MDFGIQILIALAVSCAIGIPVALYKYQQYRNEGRSIKYLTLKISLLIGFPIMSIPVLLSDELLFSTKVVIIIAGLIAGIAYSYGIRYSRKSFRKVIGLSPEDDHTGEVIKDKGKTKED